MKVDSTPAASCRIFSKALNSALMPPTSKKGTVVMAPSIRKRVNLESEANEFGPPSNVLQSPPSCVFSFVQKSVLEAIDETLQTVPQNSIEDWARKNRLHALNKLKSSQDLPVSSVATVSNDKASPLAKDGPVCTEGYAKCNILKVECAEIKHKSAKTQRPVGNQQERPKQGFNHKKEFCQMNSGNWKGVNSWNLSDAKITHLVGKETNQCANQKSSQPQSSRPKSSHVTNPLFDSESRNCCKPQNENINVVAKLPYYDPAPLKYLKSSTGFYDSHCHIDMLFEDEKFNGTYADYMAQHESTYPNSYKGCITVFCKPFLFSKVHVWRKHLEQSNVWGAFGCHPKQARSYSLEVERQLERCLDHHKVQALGEIGLDYSKANWRFKKDQHFALRRQLKIAQERNLRVVIHCRDADDDAIKILKEFLPEDAVFHLHCFTGSWKKAQMWIKAFPNVRIGITNLVTFPSAVDTHEVATRLPLDKLLLETDAPFFVPKRAPKGTRFSHPGMAIHVAAQIAALRRISVEEVLQATHANTRFVYNLP